MEKAAGFEAAGIRVVLFDGVVVLGKNAEIDRVAAYPLVDDALVAGVVATTPGLGARDVLEAGDRGCPLDGTSDREDAAVDLVRMAFVGAGFPEAGVQGRGEEGAEVEREEGADFW